MITAQSSVEAAKYPTDFFTAVPVGVAWTVKRVQDNAAFYSGSFRCRDDALREAKRRALINGSGFCQ
jgi:hypothetical protein